MRERRGAMSLATAALACLLFSSAPLAAEVPLTWEQVRDRFEQTNPTLAAGQIGIEEARAQEITAHLRPNPEIAWQTDGTQLTPHGGVWRPFSGTMFTGNVSYLHERGQKRELRWESAKQGATVAESQLGDQRRTLLYNLRNAFVQALQAKAVLTLSKENLAYYDRLLGISRERFSAGDISRVDLERLEVQRIQYLSDVQTAEVSVRSAKIQILALLNDRTPVEQFDIIGPFDFKESIILLSELREMALATRPDLRAAVESIEKANTDYRLAVANGTTDPTIATWYSRNPSFNNPFDYNTLGASVTIPLRIFDRNQGEKLRTQLDIRRNERLRQAAEAQVLSDVDSAYATLNSNISLLREYKNTFLQKAAAVRDAIAFSYQRGGASLLDFLQAQNDYRTTELSYLNLVGSYLNAASQLNLAVGREVIQ